jgi:hypothetical protein
MYPISNLDKMSIKKQHMKLCIDHWQIHKYQIELVYAPDLNSSLSIQIYHGD